VTTNSFVTGRNEVPASRVHLRAPSSGRR